MICIFRCHCDIYYFFPLIYPYFLYLNHVINQRSIINKTILINDIYFIVEIKIIILKSVNLKGDIYYETEEC